MADKLVLIDGHALAYRQFYALPLEAFTTQDGEPTNATYGFTRTVLDLMMSDDPPKYLAVSFDVGRTFRDDMFTDYKGTREKMPDELALQIERIRQVIRTMNIPVLELDGYEADDVLGTIAKQAKPLGVPVHIITGDRDLLQLVDDNTVVELPPSRYQRQPRIYTPALVVEEYEMQPRQIIDWKALEGDKSDNIPGVAGIGKKTAVKLLEEYGDLDNIYAHLDEIATRYRNKLEADRDNAYLSRKLATIVTDAPIQLNIEDCVLHEFDANSVLELFRELEFRSLSKRLANYVPRDELDLSEVKATETIVVRTSDQLAAVVKVLNNAKEIAFDVETTGLDKISAELVGICLSVNTPVAYYIPVGHLDRAGQNTSGQMNLFAGAPELAPNQLPMEVVLDAIRPAMTNPAIGKIAHNAKYDYVILQRHGLTVTPLTFDTMIAEWISDPSTKFKGLKDLSRQRLGIEMQAIETLIGKGSKQKSFAEVPIEDAAPYGSADADMTLRLVKPLRAELKEKNGVELLKLEMQLITVIADMEQQGIAIDTTFFSELSAEYGHRLNELELEIHAIADEPFNINSTQQLSDVLFQNLGLPTEGLKKTRSGYYSTSASVLESLHEIDTTGIIDKILEYRELGKLKSTYVDALPDMVNPDTGRLHTSFNQTGAVTGRLASNSPNLQNIPIRTEAGRQIRRGFVPKPGCVFLAADYSQVELRILAHVSQDEALLQAFRENQDIHRTTAATVYGIQPDAVTFEQRRFAKAVNFGLMYGMGAYRLARDSDLTLEEAEKFIKTYFERFPGVRRYLDGTKQLARDQGYVETLMGRRRYFPIFKMHGRRNRQFEARAEREAINYPIQGSAADIIKVAMLRLHEELLANYDARMLLQVHDELLLEVPEAEVDTVKTLVENTMRNAYQLDVPLQVQGSIGRNWYQLK
ncbi:MAG: DNA polymerase I [Anaerolineae bacterium]|nr:DNA polymerase I [Anaerolineae bacterium]